MSGKQNTQSDFTLQQAAITLKHKSDPDGLFVEDVLATLGYRSHSVIILFLSLPFIQPIPLIGLSTPIGILLMIFGFFVFINAPVRLPAKIMRKHLQPAIVIHSCNFLIRLLNFLKSFIKPRLRIWTRRALTRRLNGFLIMLFAFLLALPLPVPFSNTIPAWFIVLNTLADIEEDGLLMWVSYFIGLLCLIFFVAIALGLQKVWHLGATSF